MQYRVKFFDFWHLSSGASAGPALDALVVKDSDGIPYVPGKTIKGLLRENTEMIDKEKAKEIFDDEGAKMAKIYFSNATLDEATRSYLVKNKTLIAKLYDKVSATKIDDETGIAVDKSLREIEVVVPLTLEGKIECEEKELLKQAAAMIKQMGLNRNRGLGRCEVEVYDD